MRQAGFTLLEVLIALTILSAVSLVVIRAVGDGMAQIGDNGWTDQAARLGLSQMTRIMQQGAKGSAQGSFAPDYPDIRWTAKVSGIDSAPGRKLELTVRQGKRELMLERILIP